MNSHCGINRTVNKMVGNFILGRINRFCVLPQLKNMYATRIHTQLLYPCWVFCHRSLVVNYRVVLGTVFVYCVDRGDLTALKNFYRIKIGKLYTLRQIEKLKISFLILFLTFFFFFFFLFSFILLILYAHEKIIS